MKKKSNPRPPDIKHKPKAPLNPPPIPMDILLGSPIVPYSDAPMPALRKAYDDIYSKNKKKMDEISAKIDKHFEEGTVGELVEEINEQYAKRKDEKCSASDYAHVSVEWVIKTPEQIKEDFISFWSWRE